MPIIPKIKLTPLDQESESIILEVMETDVPGEFFDALEELVADIEHLRTHHEIALPREYQTSNGIIFKNNLTLEPLYKHISNKHFEIKNKTPWVNKYNLIHQRDTWLMFAMDAKVAAQIFAAHNQIDKAWNCLNIGTYHIARAKMIAEIDIRIKANISKAQKFKSKETSSQQTVNEKKSLAELFLKHSPESGWKNLKLALHEIRPHLIKELQAKKPKGNQQTIEEASEELLQKLVNWMRTDLNFKAQIDRHIQNKTVPDLTKLD